MRCSSCDHKYSAARGQPSPGGSSAPGVLLRVAIPFAIVAAIGFARGGTGLAWGGAAIAGFVLLQVGVDWGDCRHSGSECPECGGETPVRPWST
jgi:rubredoxin